ncbi:MAG TPA: transporter [Vicinamibacterales bacterium]|nr:transporter [Vicinamibacterales bacterium]
MYNNRPTARLAGAIALALASGTAGAADLQNFVTDLYGGDGVTLSSQGGPFAAAHSAHFSAESLEAFTLLNSAIASSAGQFAFNATFTGITFDVTTGVPVETQDSLGPLLAESATTLGKGKINLAFGISRFKYDSIDGQDLDSIVLDFPHEDCCSFQGGIQRPPPDGVISGFETDLVRVNLDINLEYDVFAFFANYGLTDRWDVGIVVPVLNVDASARAHAEVVPVSGATGIHSFFGQEELQNSSTGGTETGIGDVVVRTKYNFVRDQGAWPDLALLAQVTAPTGDEKKLLGTGETRYKAGLVASKRYGAFGPHVNVAYETSTGEDSLDNLSYAAGFDVRVSPTFTAGLDLLGRYNPDQETIDTTVLDAALSAKWNPFKAANAPLNAYVIVPVNGDHGLRSDVVYGIGIDIVL